MTRINSITNRGSLICIVVIQYALGWIGAEIEIGKSINIKIEIFNNLKYYLFRLYLLLRLSIE